METCIKIEALTKAFQENVVLNDISKTFESGKIYGLIGRNGCGKSVMCKLMAGIMHADSGSVWVQGVELKRGVFPPDIGIILDNTGFLGEYSGLENLKIIASIRKKIGADDIIRTMERVGLDPGNDKKYRKYSVGMKQKLAIAQAIMEDPRLLILDEPLNGLDESSVEDIRKLLKQMNQENGTTIIFTSHNREDVAYLCSDVYELVRGKLEPAAEACAN